MDDYANDFSTTARIQVGRSVSGSIEIGGDRDMLAVDLVAGQSITVEVLRKAPADSGGLADPMVTLYDAAGHVVAFDDDARGGLNARLIVTVPATGSYFIEVHDHEADGVGTYLLGVNRRNIQPSTNSIDLISGGPEPDTMQMRGGNDSFWGKGGDDLLDGGEGLDTTHYAGAMANFYIEPVDVSGWSTSATRGWVLFDDVGDEGNDVLVAVERVAFADGRLALDLDGHAGHVVKVLGAVFGAATVHDPAYVGVGLGLADGGMGLQELLATALDYRLGPNPSHAQVVDLLYTNVVGVAPSDAERAEFTAMLDAGTLTPVGLAQLAAEHELNLQNIDFVGLVDYGVVYTV